MTGDGRRELARRRKALGLSQEHLAEVLGVERSTVRRWEGGESSPQPWLRPKLARALNLGADMLEALLLVPDGTVGVAPGQALRVAVAVVYRDDDVLLVCRRDGDAGITWQFPAGVVKPGASVGTVAVRETLAETGVHCNVERELGSRLHPVTGVLCHYVLCEFLAGDVENRDVAENSEVLWVGRTDVTRFIARAWIYPPVLDVLEGKRMPEQVRDEQPGIAAAIVVDAGRVLMVRRRVAEGTLSWQFPAGGIEAGETAAEAAVREAREETGVSAVAVRSLGERVHPATGRHMSYVVCSVSAGEARLADADELAEVEWCDRSGLGQRVPVGLWGPVQEYLDSVLAT